MLGCGYLGHGFHVWVDGQAEANDVKGVCDQCRRARGGGAGSQTPRHAELSRLLVGELFFVKLIRVEHRATIGQDADHLYVRI